MKQWIALGLLYIASSAYANINDELTIPILPIVGQPLVASPPLLNKQNLNLNQAVFFSCTKAPLYCSVHCSNFSTNSQHKGCKSQLFSIT